MSARVDSMSVHEPVLVNLLGHSAGALIFGIFVVLLWRSSGHLPTSRLTRAAALTALAWNTGSLSLLAWPGGPRWWTEPLTVITASALSLLPALLLDLSLERHSLLLSRAGYTLSALAMLLHASEYWLAIPSMHRTTLLVTAAGFAALTVAGAVVTLRRSEEQLTRRAVAAMALVLFSLTFAHYHEQGAHAAWQAELLIHHAGIPLSLFVLLQDYRFVLLDAFLRFLTNILLAAAFTFAAWRVGLLFGWIPSASYLGPRELALASMAACGLLVVYALARTTAQRLLTHAVFHQPPDEQTLADIRTHAIDDEESFLAWSASRIGRHFDADSSRWRPGDLVGALPEGEGALAGVRNTYVISVGRRAGGRRYLSEDLDALARLASAVGERVERFHESEMRRLVSEAELRALQSQIHPHFLFNALNTLYGTIPKDAQGARTTVLNLADIFRYFLRTERSLIPLHEEMHIVRAYLEIEQLRLGAKLLATLDVDDSASDWLIPVLTIEPLVENAVKHGVADQERGGSVRVRARVTDHRLLVAVTDSGPGFGGAANDTGRGVGLDNVRKRLRLHYGDSGQLSVREDETGTTVEIRIPRKGDNGGQDARFDRR